MGVFAEQLKAFAEKTKKNVNGTITEIIMGVAADVIDRSPVGDPSLWKEKPPKGYVPGTFKANWVGGNGGIDYTTTDDTDPTGEVSMVSIFAAIPENPAGGIFYITNSLPYAIRLEDGWSTQAPFGMVGLTVQDFKGIVSASIAKVKIT